MQTKHIEKLRELNGFEWEDNILESIYVDDKDGEELIFKRKMMDCAGNSEFIELFEVSKNNLNELKFYGLKVILNEKPKLTREERGLVEIILNEICIAREYTGNLFLTTDIPEKYDKNWGVRLGSVLFRLDDRTFPFITWESGKAWSKAELLKLEVVE